MKLANFRNYEGLDLELGPGTVLLHGGNGEGKSNLLEALYLLAIAKSPRASADIDLVRWGKPEETHSQVAAVVARDDGDVRVQVDLIAGARPSGNGAGAASIDKQIRVNGVSRRASALVGEVNAVMFSAQDLDIVLGPPTLRRRYLDVLISQIDSRYLREMQTYQRVVYQRNHLLKSIRAGHSNPGELDYWDSRLAATGQYILARRLETVAELAEACGPIHGSLTSDGAALGIAYAPTIALDPGGSAPEAAFRQAVEGRRGRDIAAGFTMAGPHRDDLRVTLDGMDAGAYASRGQCRSIVLAMRLGEARYLSERRGQAPVLLLDDVLSELDASRRAKVLDSVCGYQQCFVTTSDISAIEPRFILDMAVFTVRDGRVERDEDERGRGMAAASWGKG